MRGRGQVHTHLGVQLSSPLHLAFPRRSNRPWTIPTMLSWERLPPSSPGHLLMCLLLWGPQLPPGSRCPSSSNRSRRQPSKLTRRWGVCRGPQPVTPRPPSLRSKSTTPAGTHGASRAPVPPAATATNLPPQKRLFDVPEEARGKQWHDRMNKPYTTWEVTDAQLWEAHHLLTGKDQWATPKASYLSSVPAKGAPSMRYLCGEPSCQHRSASVLDARGHHQATHLNLTSSPLCSCRNNTFFNAATLANHLDMQHNVHPGAVMRDPPSALLMFLDRRCAPHVGQGATVTGPSTPKKGKKSRR